jgi:predicted nucleotidyltransferase
MTEEILSKLQNITLIKQLQKMNISHLMLVGSYARNNATNDSDVDLVYEKNNPQQF